MTVPPTVAPADYTPLASRPDYLAARAVELARIGELIRGISLTTLLEAYALADKEPNGPEGHAAEIAERGQTSPRNEDVTTVAPPIVSVSSEDDDEPSYGWILAWVRVPPVEGEDDA